MTTLAADWPLGRRPQSAAVTDWAARIGWLVGLLLFVALVVLADARRAGSGAARCSGDLPDRCRAAPARPSRPR